MKIVKIIQSLDFGGIERVFEVVARFDMDNKDNVRFLVLGKGGAAESYIKGLGYQVIVWNAPTKIPQWRLIWRVYRHLKRERPDIVHTTGAEANFHGMIGAWMAQTKTRISEEIGMPQHSRIARLVFRFVFRLSHGVIAVAGPVKDFLRQSGEVPDRKLIVLHNPVDTTSFRMERKVASNEAFCIVAVCRLHPIKNLSTLLRAFAALPPFRKAVLWIVGDGEEGELLKKEANDLGVQNEVVFWGYQNDVGSILAGADLFVLPSFSEGHPVSVIEAMLSGLPCIVTKVGGAPEFIVDGVNGWLMDPNDVDGLARLIQSAIQMDPEAFADMGERAKATVEEKFMPEVYLQSLYSLYARGGLVQH